MSVRHKHALDIAGGGYLLEGIGHYLDQAIKECRAEGKIPEFDAACRVIGHKVAVKLCVPLDYGSAGSYRALVLECEEKVDSMPNGK
jgi:hypothetical protein